MHYNNKITIKNIRQIPIKSFYYDHF